VITLLLNIQKKEVFTDHYFIIDEFFSQNKQIKEIKILKNF
jgi:hypothetical protein